jgi:small subunit ribosomal protein S8
MSLIDPISDLLTRIRNAYAVSKDVVYISESKTKNAILDILKANGYVEGFKKEGGQVCIELKYDNAKPVVSSIERVSKPGKRIYVKKSEVPTVLSGHGIAVISTSKGIMTGEDAKRANLGGELICRVY